MQRLDRTVARITWMLGCLDERVLLGHLDAWCLVCGCRTGACLRSPPMESHTMLDVAVASAVAVVAAFAVAVAVAAELSAAVEASAVVAAVAIDNIVCDSMGGGA